MWKCVVLILCTLAILVQGDEDWRLVNITQGPVRGRMDPEGGLYNFYNIPFATAPTGTDRFKAPLPPPVWLSTFDAVDRRIVCPQPIVYIPEYMNVWEDCLVVNVFVPDTEETNLPVLVAIHGGAYQYGYGASEQYKEFVRTKKVIVVTFNYRLGVHGFLCLGTEGAPGNAGIKDQVAALRWINKNVASFGGNREDVTLVGCSAGSGSIDILTLSSITTGLFKKAIMESGVSSGAAGLQMDPIENAKTYAKILNFENVDHLDNLEEFYRTASLQQLISRHEVMIDSGLSTALIGPCIERDIGQERVIKDDPINVLQQGNYTKIPMLYGFTNMDGAFRLPWFDTWKEQMNENFSDFLPVELHFESEDVKNEVAQIVKELYFGYNPVSEETILSFVTYFTDNMFAYPMLRFLPKRVEALGDMIYLFEYSYADEDTPTIPYTNVRGAGHCEQVIAVMDQDVTDRTEEYRQMKQIMRDYWHNFILTGSPSSSESVLPSWPAANADRLPYMSLGPVIELKQNILGGRPAFWDNIYEEYYRGPVPPSNDTEDDTEGDTEDNSDYDTDSAVSLMISNAMFATVLLSIYFSL